MDDNVVYAAWVDGYQYCKNKMAPKWTKELPKEKGWYFYCEAEENVRIVPRVGIGYAFLNDNLFCPCDSAQKCFSLKKGIPFEFAGPILEPAAEE